MRLAHCAIRSHDAPTDNAHCRAPLFPRSTERRRDWGRRRVKGRTLTQCCSPHPGSTPADSLTGRSKSALDRKRRSGVGIAKGDRCLERGRKREGGTSRLHQLLPSVLLAFALASQSTRVATPSGDDASVDQSQAVRVRHTTRTSPPQHSARVTCTRTRCALTICDCGLDSLLLPPFPPAVSTCR